MTDDRPRYMISVAAELVGMHPQTLRIYEQQLTSEVGLNLVGVAQVLHMEDELQRMRRRLERMEQEMRRALEEVHRSYRRDLVVYQPPKPPVSRN